jgi:hypothetical protein
MERKTYLGVVCGTAPRLQVPCAYNMVLVHCSFYYTTPVKGFLICSLIKLQAELGRFLLV